MCMQSQKWVKSVQQSELLHRRDKPKGRKQCALPCTWDVVMRMCHCNVHVHPVDVVSERGKDPCRIEWSGLRAVWCVCAAITMVCEPVQQSELLR